MNAGFTDKKGNTIDFYGIFGVEHDAKTADIKKAFHSLIKRYHPDTSTRFSDHAVEKIDLIIRGYRILADGDLRREYDQHLFHNVTPARVPGKIVPKKRVRYSVSLGEMLKARFLPKKMKRKDILSSFGQDVEIILTPGEALSGAVAYIELPSRMLCPLCAGRNQSCHICRGVGRIHTTSQLEVRIPPHVDDTTYIDVDLMKIKPDSHTSFRGKNLKIKISVMRE